MGTSKKILFVVLLTFLFGCGKSEETAEEFAKNWLTILKSGNTQKALKYKFNADDAGLLAERVTAIAASGVEYMSDELFLGEFENNRYMFEKNEVWNDGGKIPIKSVEFKSIDLGRERVFGKGISFYKDSNITVVINGKIESTIRLRKLWKIDGKWRVFKID